MKLHRIAFIIMVLFALPLIAQAADSPTADTAIYQEAETEVMRWPEANLEFEYPAGLNLLSAEGFEFVLADDEGNFIGLQMGIVEGEDPLQELFTGFAEDSGDNEVEELDLNGIKALSLQIPPDQNGRDGKLIGYEIEENKLALLILVGQPEWLTEISDKVLKTIVVTPLDLDTEALNAELATNFESERVLRLGSVDAPVTMVEVLDFSCPHCVNYAESMERVVQEYVNSGQMQLEFLIVTFVGGEASETATHAAYCAVEQSIGWEMMEGIFEGYRNNGTGFYSTDTLTSLVEELGADVEQFTTCMKDKKYADVIERDAQRADELGVTSTPAVLFATGEETPGFLQTPEGENWRGGIQLYFLYQEIDSLLAAAEQS